MECYHEPHKYSFESKVVLHAKRGEGHAVMVVDRVGHTVRDRYGKYRGLGGYTASSNTSFPHIPQY